MEASAILLSLLAGFTIIFFLRRKQRNLTNDIHRLPVPKKSHWLWGHEKEVFDRSQPDAYNAWSDELGGLYRIDGALWFGDILVPTDPDIISHIFTRNTYKYAKSPFFRPFIERLIGRSIIWAEGDDHKRMARFLNGHFSAEAVRGMHDTVVECAQRLSSILRSHVLNEMEQEQADSGVLVNIVKWPSRATLDIIGRVGFNYDFKCGESPESKEIARLWDEQCEMAITFAGFVAPLVLRAIPILGSFVPLKMKQAQEAVKMNIRKLAVDLAQDGIEEARAELAKASGNRVLNGNGYANGTSAHPLRRKGGRQNLLTNLVRASVQDNKEVDLNELLDHITTFIVAGHETAAGIIKYTLHALSKDQERQDKLRAELSAAGFDASCGMDGKEPTHDEITNSKTLPYLDAVVKEALRLFVTPASTERTAMEDDVIPLKKPILASDGKTVLNSIRVRKGQMFAISWLSINTNSRTWGPDSMKFKPERWLAAAEDPVNNALPQAVAGGFQHLGTFGEGPRMCIGYRLAVLEIKTLLLTLIRDFCFDAVDRVPVRDPKTGQLTGGMMDVKVYSTFAAGLVQPRVRDGERVGMDGIWLPVSIRPVEEE